MRHSINILRVTNIPGDEAHKTLAIVKIAVDGSERIVKSQVVSTLDLERVLKGYLRGKKIKLHGVERNDG